VLATGVGGDAASQFDEEEHITTTTEQKLVMMANQIAKFFTPQKEDQAVEGVRNHIAKFWDPRRRERIRDHLAAGRDGLDPLARQAIEKLSR
jgi:formate dehydrogenase subunit delta